MIKRRYWQQACGDTDRNYSQICLQWGVILNGPGYAGPYPECLDRLKMDNWKSRKRTDLRRFAIEMKSGDLVVLRLGTGVILGVGEILGDYEWHESFSDVDGWDLHHVRRVNWLWKGSEKPKMFPIYSLKQGDTTQELTKKEVLDWVQTLIPLENTTPPLKILPKPGKLINHNKVAEYLFDRGISSNSIENLINELDELGRIARWYSRQKTRPSEFETVTYLVVPLLRALGWTPQKMAVEWRKVDVALFDQLPREDKNLSIVVEVKKKGNSCLSAKGQAQGYAQGKANCNRLIVTDGLRYGIYIREASSYILKAYFNLTNLRENYPIYGCMGIEEALTIMAPEWRINS